MRKRGNRNKLERLSGLVCRNLRTGISDAFVRVICVRDARLS